MAKTLQPVNNLIILGQNYSRTVFRFEDHANILLINDYEQSWCHLTYLQSNRSSMIPYPWHIYMTWPHLEANCVIVFQRPRLPSSTTFRTAPTTDIFSSNKRRQGCNRRTIANMAETRPVYKHAQCAGSMWDRGTPSKLRTPNDGIPQGISLF